MHICPVSGLPCTNEKNIKTYMPTGTHMMPVAICDSCPILTKHLSTWKNFINTIFGKTQPPEKSPCKCGLDLPSLLTKGQLGCSNCYVHFRDFIKPILQKVQQATNHVGKKPKCLMSSLEDLLAIAIKDERYEDAAKLRDQIKELKSSAIEPSS